ncbi:hypothetical protein [Paenibacillus ginsengarvi]|uniref:Hypervirulence associated protein TUDOR domain-containing protein n=1 Tax=Paenibacillus ginsengarvi TaxID=400777 RepID=A0A3B0CN01_9BACL|nr:hypothetical protein [Paenibacillus ginsengarvi]RKN86773.1 hypothetical protein D7M11_02100 [Paenibacillus ginsengarvi]
MKIGDVVTWKSQAAGVWKEKTGEIVGFIKPEEDARNILQKFDVKYPSNRVKFQSLSELDRVLVEVPRGGRSNISDYYAPRKSQVIVVN